MKITNIIFIILLSLFLNGCATALLVTGTIVGGAYVANEVEDDYNGDFSEFISDKSEKAYDTITGE